MIKLGISPGLFVNQSILPASLRSGMSMFKETSHDNLIGSMGQLVKSIPNSKERGNTRQRSTNEVSSPETLAPETDAVNTQSTSRIEKVISNFLENPLLKEEGGKVNEHVSEYRQLNFQTVLWYFYFAVITQCACYLLIFSCAGHGGGGGVLFSYYAFFPIPCHFLKGWNDL